MREIEFAAWMRETGRKKGSTNRATQLQDIKKIDRVLGDLDQHYERDRLERVIEGILFRYAIQAKGQYN